MSNHVTITGRLGADPELRWTKSGQAVCGINVADTPRRKNDQTGQWEDAGETLWLRGSLWGAKGEALANTARKGDLVIVVGSLLARSWEQDGQKRTVTEVKAHEVAVVAKADKPSDFAQSGGWGGGTGSGGAAPASDPWAVPQQSAPFTDEPSF